MRIVISMIGERYIATPDGAARSICGEGASPRAALADLVFHYPVACGLIVVYDPEDAMTLDLDLVPQL